ncbi:MAG: hypothetical protein IJ600_01765 [Lachnospiraceae bacterium]|nr:hypothetical protein [Lachnospiraceae bacterium]
MTEERLLVFVEHLIRNSRNGGIHHRLQELAALLERDGVEEELVAKVREMADCDHEMAELGQESVKKKESLSWPAVEKAIRQGRQRLAQRC